MISALLLPLFLAGTPASIGGAPGDEPAIRLWINNDGRFLRGDRAKVEVRTKNNGYLLVLHADPDGQLRVLFPLNPDDNNFVRGGERYEVKGRGGREAFDIDATSGRGMVYAAISRDRFRFDGYRLGNDWDYHALAPSPLPREPESELTDLVRRMAQGNFDYDVLTYDVIERVVYASDYGFAPSNVGISAGFFGRPFGGFGSPFLFGFNPFFNPFFFDPFFHREVFFDPFLRPGFFFDPFFQRFGSPFLFAFDPFFFDPFFSDPFLHRDFFFDPFLRRPFLRQPVFVGRFLRQPFFFRPRGLAPVPFRDRRNDFRPNGFREVTAADHTRWRARGPATPIRGHRVELGGERPVPLAMADARRPAIQARRENWPVDVSPGRQQRVIEARRDNWPVDVSPRRGEPVAEARRDNWPVDVSPRGRAPDLPTGRRVVDDRSAGVRPQINGPSLPEARRAWRSEDRPGQEMTSPDREGWESFSSPSDRGSDRGSWGSDRGSWSSSFGSGGVRGFAPSARSSGGASRGGSRR
jgi:hypothetical protein